MSLKDLKSNLGDYRKPKKELLSKKERPEPTSFNTMPLSDKVQDKKIQSSKQTPEKVGTNPNKVTQGDKFKGQTETTQVTQGDKFKGETEPTQVTQGDKFKGETTPALVNLSEKFKGETTPSDFKFSQQFLGETTPNEFKFTQQFLGETTPKSANNSEQFLGETTQKESDRSSKFLGETTPNLSDRSSKFLGETTPNLSDRSSKFLGETTPNLSDRSSKFLGETTPNEMNLSEQFLGETDRQNITQGDRFKGETTPSDFTFNGKLESQGLEVPQKVDFFTNDKAEGFSPFMKTKDDTKFTGISGTQFDNASSLLSNFGGSSRGISFHAGYGQYKVGQPTGDTQRYSPDGDRYIDSFTSIGDLLQQRQSPSFLDEMYSKFNLKDPAANKFSLIPQPYILRGIQRKKKGEPQSWGLGFPIDDGLIRGGVVASTERALIDVLRVGSFFLSVKGLLWSATQIGLQRTNKYNKTWTPANFLAAIGGQHIGLKPDRSGILGLDVDGKYQKVLSPTEYKSKISDIYGDLIMQSRVAGGTPFASQIDNKGGIDSLYGIGLTNTSRFVNTFGFLNLTKGSFVTPLGLTGAISLGFALQTTIQNVNQAKRDMEAIQPYNPFMVKGKLTTEDKKFEETYGKAFVDAKAEDFGTGESLSNFGVTNIGESSDFEKLRDDVDNLTPTKLSKEGTAAGFNNDIADYNMMTYGKLQGLAKNRRDNGTTKDFRNELPDGTRGKLNAKEYDQENIEKKFGFGNPGKMLDGNSQVRKDQFGVDFSKLKDFTSHYDKINALKIGEVGDDLVPLIFKLGTDNSRLQFRGTISGLSENFSPSYSEIKYSGRAEPVYVYDSFKRDISFNFKIYPTSRVEMQPIYTKLERLSTYTMPRYSDGGYSAPGNGPGESELLLTIGKLYVETPMLLTSLSYSYSDDTSWDIDFGLPMGIDIQVGCTILGNALHEYDSQDVFVFDGNFRV